MTSEINKRHNVNVELDNLVFEALDTFYAMQHKPAYTADVEACLIKLEVPMYVWSGKVEGSLTRLVKQKKVVHGTRYGKDIWEPVPAASILNYGD